MPNALRLELEDFPRDSEFNLRSGIVRAYRDPVTGKPYAECRSQKQVYELRRLLGVVGPAIAIEEEREEMPGLTTHGKTVAEVQEIIDKLQNRVYLTQLKLAELDHPKFQGGRQAVLDLIQDRLEQVRDQ